MSTPRRDSGSPLPKDERVQVIDVLRGFALFGILVVNMVSFKAPVFGGTDPVPGFADQAASWLIAFGFQTKFYVLFSFLFGYGLYVQMSRAAARNVRFVPHFLRRLLGLLLIGIAHALLLYTGDILVTYALLGVVLLLMRNDQDKILLVVATILILLTALAAVAGGVATSAMPEAFLSPSGATLEAGTKSSVAAYRDSPAEVIGQRVEEYPGTLAFALFGQGPTALAMFLVGLWAARRRLFETVEEHLGLLRRVLVAGLVVGVMGGLVWATEQVASSFDFGARFLFAAAVDFATVPFFSAFYLVTIVLLYRKPIWRRSLRFLAPVGRMALSNYLIQSLVGALIFTGYGLGLYGKLGAAAGLLLSLFIFAAQIPLSILWLRHFGFGPAEWVLRSFTYARL